VAALSRLRPAARASGSVSRGRDHDRWTVGRPSRAKRPRILCYTDDEFRVAVAKVPNLHLSELVTSVDLENGVSVFGELLAGRTDLMKVMLVPK